MRYHILTLGGPTGIEEILTTIAFRYEVALVIATLYYGELPAHFVSIQIVLLVYCVMVVSCR